MKISRGERQSYLQGNQGVEYLSNVFEGNENIYLGIRPFGFHAGNMVPLIVYPYLLCEAMVQRGKRAAFNLYLFLNDYEQHEISGPDLENYPFNIYPKATTIQFTNMESVAKTYADYWAPIITNQVLQLKNTFPDVNVIPIRNSEMKSQKIFQEVLLETIKNPSVVTKSIFQATGHTMLPDAKFALPLDPVDHKPVYDFELNENGSIVLFEKELALEFDLETLDYWFYHKPLALPRLAEYQIDLCITGADHLYEGDFLIRKYLIRNYGMENQIRNFETLYTPLIKSLDGRKMSKSKNNILELPLECLIDLFRENGTESEVDISSVVEAVNP